MHLVPTETNPGCILYVNTGELEDVAGFSVVSAQTFTTDCKIKTWVAKITSHPR